ncbi:hypothetical protein SK128_015898 [Halocaridina rubra]|uniref:Uncharacterized protein n=1 Tax=Halocaridina rubra TaxID=373956 RepID=A0AAN9A1L1_HALRR
MAKLLYCKIWYTCSSARENLACHGDIVKSLKTQKVRGEIITIAGDGSSETQAQHCNTNSTPQHNFHNIKNTNIDGISQPDNANISYSKGEMRAETDLLALKDKTNRHLGLQ